MVIITIMEMASGRRLTTYKKFMDDINMDDIQLKFIVSLLFAVLLIGIAFKIGKLGLISAIILGITVFWCWLVFQKTESRVVVAIVFVSGSNAVNIINYLIGLTPRE